MVSLTQFKIIGNTVIYTDRPIGRKFACEFSNSRIFEALNEKSPKQKDLKTIIQLIKKNGGRKNITGVDGYGD